MRIEIEAINVDKTFLQYLYVFLDNALLDSRATWDLTITNESGGIRSYDENSLDSLMEDLVE